MMKKFIDYLAYLPVSLFGSIMGLCGITIAWGLALRELQNEIMSSFAHIIFEFLCVFSIVCFICLFLGYFGKILFHFETFKAEFRNPTLKPFFGTFCISLLLLPILLSRFSPNLALFMWIIGVFLMIVFSLYVVNFWITQNNKILEITPAWIIPVVGNFDIPLALNYLQINRLDSSLAFEISLFATSVGVIFTLPIVTLILYRILFHEKLGQKLMPTLLILIAPFAVGFSAFFAVGLEGEKILFFAGLFLFLALCPILRYIKKCCPFRVSWWAVSFPLSALNVATFTMYQISGMFIYKILAFAMLILFSLLIFWLVWRTLSGIFKAELKNIT